MSFFFFVSQKLFFQNMFILFWTIYPDFPNIAHKNVYFIIFLLLFSFSLYLEVFQITMGNKQLLFKDMIWADDNHNLAFF